jgi:hypothetical protein
MYVRLIDVLQNCSVLACALCTLLDKYLMQLTITNASIFCLSPLPVSGLWKTPSETVDKVREMLPARCHKLY